MRTIKAAAFEKVLQKVMGDFETIEEFAQALSASSDVMPDTWRKRFTPGRAQWCWLGRDLSYAQVDQFLTAANATHLWHVSPLAVKQKALCCEDCGVEIGPDNYRPLDLFRPQAGSSGKYVWDATKQRWAKRPAQGPKKRARRNGRRFRVVDLCRRCAGEALRQRAANGASVTENGHKRYMSTKERIPPKRGGRPRLMTDDQLRAAYTVYLQTGISRGELATRIWRSASKGTEGGYHSALLYGWRRLGLPLTRTKGEQIGISLHGTDGTLNKAWKVQCKAHLKNGKRCTQWVRKITEEKSSHPAEDGLCHSHACMTREARKELRTAA